MKLTGADNPARDISDFFHLFFTVAVLCDFPLFSPVLDVFSVGANLHPAVFLRFLHVPGA
jgi:hypothetical protein